MKRGWISNTDSGFRDGEIAKICLKMRFCDGVEYFANYQWDTIKRLCFVKKSLNGIICLDKFA